jgi:hypothetical protein
MHDSVLSYCLETSCFKGKAAVACCNREDAGTNATALLAQNRLQVTGTASARRTIVAQVALSAVTHDTLFWVAGNDLQEIKVGCAPQNVSEMSAVAGWTR